MRALKLKRRPPFTTLAHRLMNPTFSVVSLGSLGVSEREFLLSLGFGGMVYID